MARPKTKLTLEEAKAQKKELLQMLKNLDVELKPYQAAVSDAAKAVAVAQKAADKMVATAQKAAEVAAARQAKAIAAADKGRTKIEQRLEQIEALIAG